MKEPLDIVICPVITEKGTALKEMKGQYLFKVQKDANKIEIKRAIEGIYKVKVDRINTLLVRGKLKKRGRSFGKTPDWKKAIITLKEGESIDFV